MQIQSTQNGIRILLTGDEVATAIHRYCQLRGIIIAGPRTVTVGGQMDVPAEIFVDPSAFLKVEHE